MAKRKNRKTKKTKKMIMTLFFSVCFISVGYSLISSTISVVGTASAPEQTKLNNQINMDGLFYTTVVSSHRWMTRTSETLVNTNEINSSYIINKAHPVDYTWETSISYTNLNNYTLTGGSYSVNSNCGGDYITKTASIPATINYNETVTMNFYLENATKYMTSCTLTYIITYYHDSVPKYLYYNIIHYV